MVDLITPDCRGGFVTTKTSALSLVVYSALVELLNAAAELCFSPGAASVWTSSSSGCGRGAPGNASASGNRGRKTLKERTRRAE